MLHNDQAAPIAKLLDAHAEAERFREWTARWHHDLPNDANAGDGLQQLHRANFDLWHLEDQARDPDAMDSTIAHVKRSIDGANQRRNDTVERIDTALLAALAEHGLPAEQAPLHSETPGMMLDRLSILALKIFHTAEQAGRADVDSAHLRNSRQRLAILEEQSADLAACLSTLWPQITRGERRFRLYRQMKMYNDPQLNPVLYGARHRRSMSPS